MEFNLTELRKKRRPLWMTQLGADSLADIMIGGGGDIWMDRLWPEWTREYGSEFTPEYDFYQENDKYYLKMEVPGCHKDDIKVSISNGRDLTVSGAKQEEETATQEQQRDYYRKQSKCGLFRSSMRLPEEVEDESTVAVLKDGVLTIIMPRKAGQSRRNIPVS